VRELGQLLLRQSVFNDVYYPARNRRVAVVVSTKACACVKITLLYLAHLTHLNPIWPFRSIERQDPIHPILANYIKLEVSATPDQMLESAMLRPSNAKRIAESVSCLLVSIHVIAAQFLS
jgi:hypothetical protein